MTATPLIMIVSVWSKLQLGIDNKDYHHHHYHLQQCHSIIGGVLTWEGKRVQYVLGR